MWRPLIPKKSTLYVDGVKRLFYLAVDKKIEIQLSKKPVFYIGQSKLTYWHEYLEGVDDAILRGELMISKLDTEQCLAKFMSKKEMHLINVDKSKITTYYDQFNPENYACWIYQ